jgi:transcriptional regulator with XRE-family HTH domain
VSAWGIRLPIPILLVGMMVTSRVSKSEVNTAVGKEIAAYRAHRGMSQVAVADDVGFSESTMVRLEKGERDITVEYLVAICKALRVAPSELIRSAERRPENHAAFQITRVARAGQSVRRSPKASQPQPGLVDGE